jgi:hypothetical protein
MGLNIDRVLLDAVTIHHHGIWQEEIRLGYLISAKQCRGERPNHRESNPLVQLRAIAARIGETTAA